MHVGEWCKFFVLDLVVYSQMFSFLIFLMVYSFDDVQVLDFFAVGLLVVAKLWRSFLIPIVLVLKVGWTCYALFCGIGCYRMSCSYVFS